MLRAGVAVVVATAASALALAAPSPAAEQVIRVDGPDISLPMMASGGGVYLVRGTADHGMAVDLVRLDKSPERLFKIADASPYLPFFFAGDRIVAANLTYRDLSDGLEGPFVLRGLVAVGRPGGKLRELPPCATDDVAIHGSLIALTGECHSKRKQIRVYQLKGNRFVQRAEIVVPRRHQDPWASDEPTWSRPELDVNNNFVSLVGRRGVLAWNWRSKRIVRRIKPRRPIWSATLAGRAALSVIPYDRAAMYRSESGALKEILFYSSRSNRPKRLALPYPDLALLESRGDSFIFNRGLNDATGDAELVSVNKRNGTSATIARAASPGFLSPDVPANGVYYSRRGCWWTDIYVKSPFDPTQTHTVECLGDVVESSLALHGDVLSFDFICPLGCEEGFIEIDETDEFDFIVSAAPGEVKHLSRRVTPYDAATMRASPTGALTFMYSRGLTERTVTHALTSR